MPTFSTEDLFGPSIASGGAPGIGFAPPIAPTGVPGISFAPPPAPVNDALPLAIKNSAFQLGVSPTDLATAIGYETAGTFDPWKKGPTTKWGTHRGLIQWGEPQAAQYGVNAQTPVDEQMMAATQYLKDAGVKPGMGLKDIYSAINAGKVGRYNASDRPGMTVAKHVDRMTQEYGPTAQAMIGEQPSPMQPMTLGPDESAPTKGKVFSTADLFGAPQAAPQAPPAEQPYKPTPWSEIADDTANSIISKGIGGITGLAGLPGDIEQAGNAFMKYLNPSVETRNYLPNSTDTENWVKSKIGDYSYEPKTGAGEIAGAVAGYAGSGAGLGGKTVAKQALQSLATGGAAEAGQLIGGAPGEAIGALVASHGASAPTIAGKAPKITAADRALSEADQVISPATAAVHRVSQDAYKAADTSGVMVNGNRLATFLTHLKAQPELQKIKLPGDTFRMAPKDLTVSQFDDLRKDLVKITIKDTDPNKRRLAGIAIDRMDKFFDAPGNVTGNGPAAKAALQEARQNWKMYRKSADFDAVMEAAKDRAGQYSVSGNENAIRTGFRQLSQRINRDKRTRNLYTPDEIKVIRQLSRGGHVRDLTRGIGAVLNSRNAQLLGTVGVAGAQGLSMYQGQGIDPWSIIVGSLGYGLGKGARGLSGALAKGKANQLSKLIRSGGKMTAQPGLPGFGEFRPLPMAGALLGLKNSLGQ